MIINALLVCIAYVVAQMLADIGSLKIILFAGMSMDAGTLVYPFTFTLRDMVHKLAGVKVARILIITAGVVNIIMAFYFWLVGQLPGDMSAGDQSLFAMVLSPAWRIVIASIIAELIAEMVDTEAYTFWVNKVTKRYQWMRVLFSNTISVPLDSIAFCWVAFGGLMPNEVVWSIVLANIVVKGAVTLISLPGIYLVKDSGHRK